jgi:hypothetical protein
MGFLLGAFGKLAAGRRVRQLQAQLMRVQSRLRIATRQSANMSKMLETQKKAELNNVTYMSNMANTLMPNLVRKNCNIDDDTWNLFNGMGSFNSSDSNTTISDETKVQYGKYQNALSQMKANNEMYMTQWKQQIEDKYENLTETLLEPLKDEEDLLNTEKDSLESQIQIAQADYDACKKMEQADAKNLAPSYTAG